MTANWLPPHNGRPQVASIRYGYRPISGPAQSTTSALPLRSSNRTVQLLPPSVDQRQFSIRPPLTMNGSGVVSPPSVLPMCSRKLSPERAGTCRQAPALAPSSTPLIGPKPYAVVLVSTGHSAGSPSLDAIRQVSSSYPTGALVAAPQTKTW